MILQYGGNLFTAFLISSIIGIVLGLINGLLIHFLQIPPIITTIATLNLYFGCLYVISTGNIIYRVAEVLSGFIRGDASRRIPNGCGLLVWSCDRYLADFASNCIRQKHFCAGREFNRCGTSWVQNSVHPPVCVWVYGIFVGLRRGRAYGPGSIGYT